MINPQVVRLRLYKAEAIASRSEVPDTVLHFETTIPLPSTLADARGVYREQAAYIGKALSACLPQAVLHELAAFLLDKCACYYRGPAE